MSFPAWMSDAVTSWWPVLTVVLLFAISAISLNRLLVRYTGPANRLGALGQVVMLGWTGVATICLLLVLPISDEVRGQLFGLFGVVVTAAIALSSTTFIGNAMAGLMLRAIQNIKPGDFVRVGEHFGRVSEQGLLHTEIQTEDSDLTTLPNLHLVTNPVTVIRSSGTILSATVSLGYDVSRTNAERSLLDAALAAELKEPFVHVVDLGDFSITYRLAGLLEDVKTLLSARSRLRACMLDALHGDGIEIVSPNFMNQRVLPPEFRVVPTRQSESTPEDRDEAPEGMIFEKAEAAEENLHSEERLAALRARAEELEKKRKEATDDSSAALATEAGQVAEQIAHLEALLAARAETNGKNAT